MDEDLTRRFAELRAHDRQRTPSFDAVLAARPRARRAPLRLAAAIAVLAVTGAVTAVIVHRNATRFQPVALASWQSPTAFLLTTPGADLLSTVPSVTASIVHIEKGDTT